MSHFTTVRTKFTDPEVLVQALIEVGPPAELQKLLHNQVAPWTAADIERHQQPQHLYGYCGDRREQQAEIIVRGMGWENLRKGRNAVGGASNDIGFYRATDGTYAAHISQNEVRWGYGKGWMDSVARRYAMGIVRKNAPWGYEVVEEQQGEEIFVTLVGRSY